MTDPNRQPWEVPVTELRAGMPTMHRAMKQLALVTALEPNPRLFYDEVMALTSHTAWALTDLERYHLFRFVAYQLTEQIPKLWPDNETQVREIGSHLEFCVKSPDTLGEFVPLFDFTLYEKE